MIRVDGKKIAQELIAELKELPTSKGFLALFSADPSDATQSFIAQKKKVAAELSVDMRVYDLGACKGNDDARRYIQRIVSKKRCLGALIQLPLPARFNGNYLANALPIEKDVDVLSARATGAFYNGDARHLPAAVKTLLRIVDTYGINLQELSSAAVVGCGMLVGKPIAHYLMGRVPQVQIYDKGSDLTGVAEADLVVTGTGVPGLITQEMIKKGAIVIDFGYGLSEGKLRGDIDMSAWEGGAALITPTPGGTGPVLVAELFDTFYSAYTDR